MDEAFSQLIRRYRAGKGRDWTHNSLIEPKGIYQILPQNLEEFFNVYCNTVKREGIIGLAENYGPIMPLIQDIDLRYNWNEVRDKYKLENDDENPILPRLYSQDLIRIWIRATNQAISELYQVKDEKIFICAVLEKEGARREGNIVKAGFHLHHMFISSEAFFQQYMVRPRIMNLISESGVLKTQEFKDIFGIDHISDPACPSITWMMYGSRKDAGLEPYLLTHIFNKDIEEKKYPDRDWSKKLDEKEKKKMKGCGHLEDLDISKLMYVQKGNLEEEYFEKHERSWYLPIFLSVRAWPNYASVKAEKMEIAMKIEKEKNKGRKTERRPDSSLDYTKSISSKKAPPRKEIEIPLEESEDDTSIMGKDEVSPKKKSKISLEDDGDRTLAMMKDLLELYSTDRLETRNSRARVRWAMKMEGSNNDIEEEAKALFNEWCLDLSSIEKHDLDEEWNEEKDPNDLDKKLTLGSMRYWAKDDDPEGYEKFCKKWDGKGLSKLIKGTDDDHAELCVKALEGDVYFINRIGGYAIWDTKTRLWSIESRKTILSNRIGKILMKACDNLSRRKKRRDEDSDSEDEERQKREKKSMAKLRDKCGSVRHCDAIVSKVNGMMRDYNFQSLINSRDYLLPLKEGKVIDLRTGEVRQRERDDYFTVEINAKYNKKASYERFEKAIKEICSSDNMVLMLQEILGYFCSGSTFLRRFFYFYGPGRGGKSFTLEILNMLLGDHFFRTGQRSIVTKAGKGSSDESHTAHLNVLIHSRVCRISETDEEQKISSAQMKELTGEKKRGCRKLGEEFKERKLRGKIIVLSNFMIDIPPHDQAAWDRLVMLYFDRYFSDEDPPVEVKDDDKGKESGSWLPAGKLQKDEGKEKKDDEVVVKRAIPDYHETFDNEKDLSGILNWIIIGSIRLFKNKKLTQMNESKKKAEEFRSKKDNVVWWIKEKCELGEKLCESYRVLRDSYEKTIGEKKAVSERVFSMRLTELGYITQKKNSTTYRKGIRIKKESEDASQKKDDEGANPPNPLEEKDHSS